MKQSWREWLADDFLEGMLIVLPFLCIIMVGGSIVSCAVWVIEKIWK